MSLIQIDTRPTPERVQRFGRLWFPLFVGAAGLLLRGEHPVTARVLWGIAAAVCALAFVRPAAVRPVYVGLIYATAPIGWIVSHLVLGLVYYLVVTPLGLLLRLLGRDTMTRGFDASRSTYWVEVEGDRSLEHYFRQF